MQQLRWIGYMSRPDFNSVLRGKKANISCSTLKFKKMPLYYFSILSFFKMSASCIFIYLFFISGREKEFANTYTELAYRGASQITAYLY